METLYRKLPNGRYEPHEVSIGDSLPDGIWFIQTQKSSRSLSNIAYKIGEITEPKNVISRIDLISIEKELGSLVYELRKENISAAEFANKILNFLSEKL